MDIVAMFNVPVSPGRLPTFRKSRQKGYLWSFWSTSVLQRVAGVKLVNESRINKSLREIKRRGC